MSTPPLALRLLLVLAVAFAASGAGARDLVEYYHPGLDHYFLTGEAREIQALDAGTFSGWMRTGELMAVFDPGTRGSPAPSRSAASTAIRPMGWTRTSTPPRRRSASP